MSASLFDLHVHSAPCVFPRLADDLGTVRLYGRAGFSGCVLKGHVEPTAGRAEACAAASGLQVYGGLVLNASAGGLNPSAVTAALALGARVVWLPTLDARHHTAAGLPQPPGRTGGTLACPPADWGTEVSLNEIFALVAEADAVLATGHVSAAECGWVVDTAHRAGVRKILLTHPTFVVPGVGSAEVEQLCALGAIAEVTWYGLEHGGNAAALAELATTLGPERCVLSSDAGQPESPDPPTALELLVEQLVSAGLDPSVARAMASDTPEGLVTA